jgi:uncharacterized membrane protein
MSEFLVIIFDTAEQATQARMSLKSLESEGVVKLDDAAVVTRTIDGKVNVKNQLDSGVAMGALGGSLIGLLLASVFFPLAGIMAGAAIGGAIGHFFHKDVDQAFVKEVTQKIEPGKSALFLMISQGVNMVIAAMEPFKGEVLQTTLTTEEVDALKSALKK